MRIFRMVKPSNHLRISLFLVPQTTGHDWFFQVPDVFPSFPLQWLDVVRVPHQELPHVALIPLAIVWFPDHCNIAWTNVVPRAYWSRGKSTRTMVRLTNVIVLSKIPLRFLPINEMGAASNRLKDLMQLRAPKNLGPEKNSTESSKASIDQTGCRTRRESPTNKWKSEDRLWSPVKKKLSQALSNSTECLRLKDGFRQPVN